MHLKQNNRIGIVIVWTGPVSEQSQQQSLQESQDTGWETAQLAECLSSTHETQGSIPSTLEATREVKTGGSQVLDHSWLHSQVLGQPGTHWKRKRAGWFGHASMGTGVWLPRILVNVRWAGWPAFNASAWTAETWESLEQLMARPALLGKSGFNWQTFFSQLWTHPRRHMQRERWPSMDSRTPLFTPIWVWCFQPCCLVFPVTLSGRCL